MPNLSTKEWLILGGIAIVVIYLATRNKSSISGANVYGMTGKVPVTPSEVLAFQNANEQSATRQDAFNLAKMNIASNLIKDSMAYQNQKDLIDKVSANDLLLLKQEQAGQRQQSLLEALGKLFSGIAGAMGGSRSGGSSGGSSGSGGGIGGGFPTIGGNRSRNTPLSVFFPPQFPDLTYDAGYVLDINSLNGSYGGPNWDFYSGWDFGPAPPNVSGGSGTITGFFDDYGNPINVDNPYNWEDFFTGD